MLSSATKWREQPRKLERPPKFVSFCSRCHAQGERGGSQGDTPQRYTIRLHVYRYVPKIKRGQWTISFRVGRVKDGLHTPFILKGYAMPLCSCAAKAPMATRDALPGVAERKALSTAQPSLCHASQLDPTCLMTFAPKALSS